MSKSVSKLVSNMFTLKIVSVTYIHSSVRRNLKKSNSLEALKSSRENNVGKSPSRSLWLPKHSSRKDY